MAKHRDNFLTSNPSLLSEARGIFDRIAIVAVRDPLADLLNRIRLTPLGKAGLEALVRVPVRELREESSLVLAHPLHQRWQVFLPNVFQGVSPQAVADFLLSVSKPAFLRLRLNRMGCLLRDREFDWRRLTRLAEALLIDYKDGPLIRVFNFQVAARWPSRMEGEEKRVDVPILAKRPIRRFGSRFPWVQAECLRLRREDRRSSRLDGARYFDFAPAPDSLPPEERQAYERFQYIAKHTAVSASSLGVYLSSALRILDAEGKKIVPRTPLLAQAFRLLKRASKALGLPCPKVKWKKVFAHEMPPVDLPLPSELEGMILSTRCPVSDLVRATARVILIIGLFTGRRSSDWAEVTLGEFSGLLLINDLCIPSTKSRVAKDIPLPLSRLIPSTLLEFVREWHAAASSKYPESATVFEILTGIPRRKGGSKSDVRDDFVLKIEEVTGFKLSRLHLLRHAFTSWAVIACLLARHPSLAALPSVARLTQGALFFSENQLENWRWLVPSLANPLISIGLCLGHATPTITVERYLTTWQTLAEMHVELRRAPKGG